MWLIPHCSCHYTWATLLWWSLTAPWAGSAPMQGTGQQAIRGAGCCLSGSWHYVCVNAVRKVADWHLEALEPPSMDNYSVSFSHPSTICQSWAETTSMKGREQLSVLSLSNVMLTRRSIRAIPSFTHWVSKWCLSTWVSIWDPIQHCLNP